MEIITGENFKWKGSSVSLGKFDGIHRGHRFLLSKVLEQDAYTPTVFTFQIQPECRKHCMDDGHLDDVRLSGNAGISAKIYTQPEKDRILEELGIEREVIFPFDERTRNLSAEAFVREVLIGKLDAKYICVGEDFGFGKGRQGSVDTLRRFQKEYGYGLEILPKLAYQDEVISSTRVRNYLMQGKIHEANILLGKPYFLMGRVAHGKALGRTLHMPTANIVPPENKLLPSFGVYATMVSVDGRKYRGVTNVGRKPTVGEFSAGVETFIMDFDRDIYGREMTVSFYQYLRPEKKFSDVQALVSQINKDKIDAMAFFEKNGGFDYEKVWCK